MRRVCFGLGLLIVAADALSKLWVQSALAFEPRWIVVEGFFRLHLVRNDGIAFGILHNYSASWKPALLVLAAVVALAVVLYYVRVTPLDETRMFIAFGLLLGGILGNLGDRLLRGYVVDFLELHWGEHFVWPTFNVADMAITCGVALIVLDSFFPRRKDEAGLDAAGSDAAPREEPGAAPALGEHRSAALIPWLLPMAFFFQTGDASGQAAEQALRQVQNRYQSVETLRARFRQVTTDRGIEQEESGLLLMKRPGKMYWEYQQPRSKVFVSDGKKSYFYIVDDKQVFESDLDWESSGDPLLFLFGQGNLAEDFEARWETGEQPLENDNRLLRLNPRRPQAEYSYLLLELEPASRIHRLTVVEPLGNRCDYILDNVRENERVPNKRFRFDVPKGVETIRQ